MKFNKRQIVIGVAILVLLIGGIVVFGLRKSIGTSTQTSASQPTDTIMPTVDSSVIVQLTPQNGGKQINLSVDNMPNGTTTMEYEISYKATNREAPGIFSVLTLDSGERNWEKTFDVGTCSSGKCIYDQVDGPMKVRLKFSGNYGDKLFEKDFNIN